MMMETTEPEDSANSISPSPDYTRFWLCLTTILLSDQVSKWIVVEHSGFTRGLYPPFGGAEIIPGFFNLVYAVNYGAAWGMLEGFSWLLIILAVFVLLLIGIFRRELALSNRAHQWSFGLISGGILGNTIDRLFRGHVVDFLDFHLPMYRWPTFNVADSAIVVGTFCYMILQFKKSPAESG